MIRLVNVSDIIRFSLRSCSLTVGFIRAFTFLMNSETNCNCVFFIVVDELSF